MLPFVLTLAAQTVTLDERFARAVDLFGRQQYEEALQDLDILAASPGDYQCTALEWTIVVWDCFDDFTRMMRAGVSCTSYDRDEREGRLIMRRLRAGYRTMSLQPLAAKIVDAAAKLRTICPSPDTVYWALWQEARVYARYGRKEELDRVLCELATSFMERDAGLRAARWLADGKVACSAE